MLYIMYGEDSFSSHQALDEFKMELGAGEMLEVNTTLLDGQQLSLNQLKDACSTYPSFFSQFRLVIVEGLLGCFEPEWGTVRYTSRSKLKSRSELKEWQSMGDYMGEMPSTTVLILVDRKIANNNPLLKHLLPLAKVKTFPPLQKAGLGNWIQKRVTQGGGSIYPEAVNLLVALVGGDLWSMSSEVDKLLAYSMGRIITEDDVRQLTSYAREANIFALVDAVLEGRLKVAQQLLYRSLQEGMPTAYILTMITRQLRLIVRAKELSQKMNNRSKVQTELGLTSNYAFDKTLRQAKKYTMEQLREAYHKILETDIAIKTGKYDTELAIDLLIVDLCRG